MRICVVCGQPIDPESKARKYCSDACRAKVKYEKDRAWIKTHPDKPAQYSRKFYAEHIDEQRKMQRERYRRKCIESFKKP